MPLNKSRLSSPSAPAPEEAKEPAAVDTTVSPRRRGGLSTTSAAADPNPEPRKDALEEQEEQETDEAAAGTPEPPAAVEAPKPTVGRPAGAKDKAPRAPRAARAPVVLPEGAEQSDDPVILRRVLTAIDNEARELRLRKEAEIAEIDAKYKPEQDRLKAEYKAVSSKLANVLF